ncbi:uncharacterized protein N7473_004534 [Penicillium subrubescens]|uniref:Transcription factor domain-containing protein n=1 Tax=Penicillium subrubescens TaxID=1316194 RepID=A0A1Q5TQG2_9EURO|nr:uncharacterized protein N7473_004534 [Penicillium subrubescens]KAJ5900464.1 hypothetical protein N7473_004534 [Penicillium subrubescens]OKP02462.1 hypothetical protein PENSUB_6995 [Penicillium subrubescens]
MDEQLVPALAYEAISIQTRESFDTFLNLYFPKHNACVQSRLQVKWMDFLRSGWSTFPPALVWSLRALMTLLMGASQGNKQAILCARHMYGRGIQNLASLLQSPAALADETLAAAMLLGGYEVLDGNSHRSWIVHARGIAHLMRARGSAAHQQGMGRAMLMAWRPFLIADAFVNGVPCFLGDPEWRRTSMNEEIARAENKGGLGSLLGQMTDYAFSEVAKCPGYLAATNELVTVSAPASTVNLGSLIAEISESKEYLVQIESMLSSTEPSPHFVGVMPSMYATTWVQGTCEGVASAVAFLDHLLATLGTISRCFTLSQSSGLVIRNGGNHDDQALYLSTIPQTPVGLTTQSSANKHSEDIDLESYDIGDRLDRFSLTMGMGSLLPATCGFPAFSAYDAISDLPTKPPSHERPQSSQ